MPLFGPPDIQKMKDKRDVQGLIKALDYKKDAKVRSSAASALEELKDPLAVEPLIAAIKDTDFFVQLAAVHALGTIGDSRALGPIFASYSDGKLGLFALRTLHALGDARVGDLLIEILRTNSGGQLMRYDALNMLVEIRDERVINELKKSLKREDPLERAHAVDLLGDINDPRGVESLVDALGDKEVEIRRKAVKALGKIGDAYALAPLLKALQDADAEIRRLAHTAIGNIDPASGIDTLCKVLEENDGWLRVRAAELIGKIGDNRAEKPLHMALNDPFTTVRLAAIKSFEVNQNKDAIQLLLPALRNPDRNVRICAASILEKLGWEPGQNEESAWFWEAKGEWDKCIALGSLAVESLIIILSNDDDDVRKKAASMLGTTGNARAIEPLVSALKDQEITVREAAASALEQIGWKPDKDPNGIWYWIVRREWEKCSSLGDVLFEMLSDALGESAELRRMVVEALGKIGDSRGAKPLIAALTDGDPLVRDLAMDSLVALGDPFVVEMLINTLKDNVLARRWAIEVLGRIGDARAVDSLIALLRLKDEDVSAAAARALGKIGHVRAVEPLIGILNGYESRVNKNDKLTEASAEALGMIGDPGSIKPLIHCLQGCTYLVHKAAANALIRLYRRGLPEEIQQEVLSQRTLIETPHSDHDDHDDNPEHCSNQYSHYDFGVGIDFSL